MPKKTPIKSAKKKPMPAITDRLCEVEGVLGAIHTLMMRKKTLTLIDREIITLIRDVSIVSKEKLF